jgi:hypothetical protein
MKFLTNWRINLEKVPSYIEFNQEFKEQVDYALARMILDYEGDDRLTPLVKQEFEKLVGRINPNTNILPVKYSPRYKIGRRYPDCPKPTFPNGQPNPAFDKYCSALISQPRIIKNTIFHYQGWVDIDQRKGHPNLLLAVADKNELDLPAYKSYLLEGNFDKIVASFANYYNLEPEKSAEELAEMNEEEQKEYFSTRIDKKDIKWLFNKTIYGGGHSKWAEDIENGVWTKDGTDICKRPPKELKNSNNPHPFYKEFKKDTQKVIDLVFLNNEAINQSVCKDIEGGADMDWRRKNRVMSYFCGIIEHEITFKAYKYLVENHLIEKGFCDWGLDGITFPSPAPYTDFDFHINEMNEYVRKQTGLSRIQFVRKEFDKEELLMPLIEARRNLVVANPIQNQGDIPVVNGVAVLQAEGVENEDNVSQLSNPSSVVLNNIIDDDNEGAELIYNLIKDRFKFCSGNIFFKQTNVWVNSKHKVDNHLLHFILTKTNLSKLSGGKNPTPKPYSTNVGGAKALREALYAKLIVEGEDNTLLQKFITTTRGKLCFLDGVLDLTYINPETQKKGKFYVWEPTFEGEGEARVCNNEGEYVNFPYYTPVQIERNFAEYFANPVEKDMETIKSQIFANLFGEVDCERALSFFARGVAGHFEDKAWSLYIGNRNSGKGVIDCLAKSSIGQYHANVEAQNLLCNSSRTLKQEQPEKQMAFAMDFQFARLTFSQELPPPPKNKSIKLNADIIKKLCSGGDPLKGKRNYDIFITEFINQSRLIIMANDCPSLTNEDALQTCCEFNSTISFKTKEEIDGMKAKGEDPLVLKQFKIGDPFIKDKCKTDEWCNAFIMLMVKYYQDHAVPCVDKVELNPVVGEDNEEDPEENKSNLRKFIITAFEITNKDTDFLKCDAIQEVFEEKQYGDISSKKISIELKAIGLKNAKKGGSRGYLGIKVRPPPVQTDAQGNEV